MDQQQMDQKPTGQQMDRCRRGKMGACIYHALVEILGKKQAPTKRELNEEILKTYQIHVRTEPDLLMEDCGRKNDTWCLMAVERAIRKKHGQQVILQRRGNQLKESKNDQLIIGTLNRQYKHTDGSGWVDDGLSNWEWCHAIAVSGSAVYDTSHPEGLPLQVLTRPTNRYLDPIITVYDVIKKR